MRFSRDSSAPHLHPAKEWRRFAGDETRLLLYQNTASNVEVGVRSWMAGSSRFTCEHDMLCYVQRGHGTFRRNSGETIAVSPDTAVHFKSGWHGMLDCAEALEASYMTCDGGQAEHTPVLRDVLSAAPLKDWGVIPTMLEGESRTAGILISREPSGRAESGIWTCTPGVWRCEVTADEFCHFLDGTCTYTHGSGEEIGIGPDTLAFFPRGWKGTCAVQRTMRKVYMIR